MIIVIDERYLIIAVYTADEIIIRLPQRAAWKLEGGGRNRGSIISSLAVCFPDSGFVDSCDVPVSIVGIDCLSSCCA